jgi:hypothetical protein
MAHRKKIQIYFLENTTIDKTFQIREDVSVLAFSVTVTAPFAKNNSNFDPNCKG